MILKIGSDLLVELVIALVMFPLMVFSMGPPVVVLIFVANLSVKSYDEVVSLR